MLAEPDLVEADRVGALDDLEVFLQQRVIAPAKVLDRVHEHAEFHRASPGRRCVLWPALWGARRLASNRRAVSERRTHQSRLTP